MSVATDYLQALAKDTIKPEVVTSNLVLVEMGQFIIIKWWCKTQIRQSDNH